MVSSDIRRASIAGPNRRSSITAPIQKLFRRSSTTPQLEHKSRSKSYFVADPYKEIRSQSVSYVDYDPFNISSEQRPLSFLDSNTPSPTTLNAIAEDEPEILYRPLRRASQSVAIVHGRTENKHHRATMMNMSHLGAYRSTAEREAEMTTKRSSLLNVGNREEEIESALALLEQKIMAQNNSYLQQFYEDDSIEYVRNLSVG